MAETIEAVAEQLRARGRGELLMPPKVGLYPSDRRWFHAQMSHAAALGRAVIKWQSGYADNPPRGLRYLMGLLVLNDAETGAPLAVMESTWPTAQRTGAASAVAARLLARPGAATLALLGCGVQARTQLEALALALESLQTVLLYDVVPANAQRFAAEGRARYPHLRFALVDSAEAAVRGGDVVDVVVTMGPIERHAARPIRPDWPRAGSLAIPLDYDCYWSAAALAAADRYYVDDLEQYRGYQAGGEFFQDGPPVLGDLPALLVGSAPGRARDDERIVAMNMGISAEDIAVATRLYDRAVAASVGRWLPLYDDA
jgi:ornithine cyclodeaminase/alanine dehydrogenase